MIVHHERIFTRQMIVTENQARYIDDIMARRMESNFIKRQRESLKQAGYDVWDLPRLGKQPGYMPENWSEKRKRCSFGEPRSCMFSTESAFFTEVPLPETVYACDPGMKSVWCISRYDVNPKKMDTQEEASKIINLTRGQYNTEIGLRFFQKNWRKKPSNKGIKLHQTGCRKTR